MSTVERGARVRFPPPLVFLLCAAIGLGLRYAVVPAHVPVDVVVRVALGVLVQASAVALVASARILFHRTGQNPVPWTPTPELIASGPYRFTRNPMYLGITVFLVGLGVTLDALWISLFAGPALLVVHFIAVRPEEEYLRAKFGEPYERYLARVRRYL